MRAGQVMSAVVTLTTAAIIAFVYGWKLAIVLSLAIPLVVGASYQQQIGFRKHQRRDAKFMDEAGRVRCERASRRFRTTSLNSLFVLCSDRHRERAERAHGTVAGNRKGVRRPVQEKPERAPQVNVGWHGNRQRTKPIAFNNRIIPLFSEKRKNKRTFMRRCSLCRSPSRTCCIRLLSNTDRIWSSRVK